MITKISIYKLYTLKPFNEDLVLFAENDIEKVISEKEKVESHKNSWFGWI